MTRNFKVKSRTKDNIFYEVLDNGSKCDCPSGIREKNCNHKDIIKKFLNREILPLNDLERIKEIK